MSSSKVRTYRWVIICRPVRRFQPPIMELINVRKCRWLRSKRISMPWKSEINTNPSLFQNWTCCANDRNWVCIVWSLLANVQGFAEFLLRYLMNHPTFFASDLIYSSSKNAALSSDCDTARPAWTYVNTDKPREYLERAPIWYHLIL